MSSADFRIGVVSWDYDPPYGGMGVHARTLVSGLRESGADVQVFSRRDVWYVPGRSVGFSLALPFVLSRWIKRHRIEVLHVHAGPGGVFLLQGPGIPVVVTANHTYAQQSRLPGQWWKRPLLPLERRTYRMARRIACLSPDTADSVKHSYGIPESTVGVVPCGFPLGPWVRADEPLSRRSPSAVFVGRKDLRKGFDLLFAAWPHVLARVPGAVLHVVGFSGALAPGIRFHGRIADPELHGLAGGVRCLVCPSRLEGFGLAAAEAIAAGTPVIACDSDGIRSVVADGISGILTTPDPQAIADAVVTLIQDDALWRRLHDGCLAERGQFDAAAETASYRRIFDSVYLSSR